MRKLLLGFAFLLLATGARAQSLSASPSSLFAGAYSTATWSDIAAPTSTDWIGLYVPGSADTAFISWRYTDGNAAASVPFLIPIGQAAGTYELRLYANDGFSVLATSASFSVTTPPAATLSANPTSLIAGQSTTASWTNIVTPSATDWIGLFTPGAANTAFLSWRYTDGNAAGSVSLQVPYGTAPGTYELRLFSNDGFTLIATSSGVTVTAGAPITLSASPAAVMQGGSVTASWANISAPSATDWIGLYLPGAADTAFVSWRYTDGNASGSVPFDIGASIASGTYQLRLFSNDGFTRLATSGSFTVGVTPLALHFIQVDHLNTPRAIYDADQNLKWKWDQAEPFGVNVPDENPSSIGAFEFPVRFPGHYFDKETNLNYSYMRDYDPLLGRFAESDPVGLEAGPNTYAYVDSDPLSYFDEDGLAKQKAGKPGGGAKGGNNQYQSQLCFLYGFRDCKGRLVYLGITNNIDRRMREHEYRGIKKRFECATCKFTHTEFQVFDDRFKCVAAEAAAIAILRPIFNVQFNLDPPEVRAQKQQQWKKECCGG